MNPATSHAVLHRHGLTDAMWAKIEPLLPGRPGCWGGIAKDNRKFVNAVLWIARTGAPWRDLPPEYGGWSNTHRRFIRWRDAETADERRDIADIPPEEIANAMYEILLGFQSGGQEALYRETLKELGYSTLTDRTRPYLDAALDVLRRAGKV